MLCFCPAQWRWWCPPHLPSDRRGGSTASAVAPMEAVSVLGGCASGHQGGLDARSLPTLFSSDFYHSPPPKKSLNRFCYFQECYSEILHMVSFIV